MKKRTNEFPDLTGEHAGQLSLATVFLDGMVVLFERKVGLEPANLIKKKSARQQSSPTSY